MKRLASAVLLLVSSGPFVFLACGSGPEGGDAGPPPVKGCWRACATVADCCPSGDGSCVGAKYPSNYKCEDSNGDGQRTCVLPECEADADCNPGGAPTTRVCALMRGGSVHACVRPCAADTDCAGTAKCIGADASGAAFCSIEKKALVCSDDSECGDFGVCDAEGRCVCSDSSQCEDGYAKDCVVRDL